MKKFLLTTIVCLVTGMTSLASNEKLSEIVENNCYSVFSISRGGTTSMVTFDTHAESREDCANKAKQHAQLFLDAGYEVGDRKSVV